MTGERRDESVSFSLQELKRLEDDRLDRERREREREAAAARAAQEEAERVEREARARAHADQQSRDRLRLVEEEARREAISRAAVEQARIAVEARARSEEAERERRHEIELAKLRVDVEKPGGAGVAVGSGLVGAACAAGACLVVYFAAVRPPIDRSIAALEAEVARAEAKSNDSALENLKQAGRIRMLEENLRTANDELVNLRDGRKGSSKSPGAGSSGGSHPGSSGHPAAEHPSRAIDKCAGNPDPLCGLDLTKSR